MLKHKYETDTLNRKSVAIKYANFIKNLGENHTIALDAPWGTGKTKFIDFMCEEFDKNKDVYIRYNAWDHDYTNEPFLSLMNDFFTAIQDQGYTSNQLKNIKEHSYNAVKTIGSSIFKGLAKKAIGSEAAEAVSNEVKAFLSDVNEDIINETFNSLTKSQKSRKSFTKELEKTVQNILTKTNKKQFIFIIDELDRCKPTFAIELLENIKHLFKIREIVFLIAVDKTQLSESIKVVYGQNFDSKTYLYRFFDLDLYLNIETGNDFFRSKLSQIDCTGTDVSTACWYATNNLGLSLRDFERITSEVYKITVFNNVSDNNEIAWPNKLFILLILKYKMYDEFCLLEVIMHSDYLTIKKELFNIDKDEKCLKYLDICKGSLLTSTGYGEDESNLQDIVKKQFDLIKTTFI